ncbi:hypothetical protein SETIT_6G078600v2 [Setaria italica]|uniref:Uncharacterized protein n=1 Tax=Setaria italica TaxID=4555 RepID=A0A368RJD1_SETIT|nr:hypothetical protein SETIT_6G078600v2 [Setaria italica]
MVGGDGGLVDASARSRPVLVPYPSHQRLRALSSSRIGADAGHDSLPRWVPAGWVHARVRGGNRRRWRPGLVRLVWGRASSRERTSACSPSARSRHQPWQVRVSSSERRGRTASGGKRPIPGSGWAGCIR